MTAVLEDRRVDDAPGDVPVRDDAASAVAGRFPSAAFTTASPAATPAPPTRLVWADSGHGSRPDTAPEPGPDARVINLGLVEEFPLPGVEVVSLVALLSSLPVADLSGAALVNSVAASQQAINMLQAVQATFVRELEARTPDALRHVPDELACALVCTRQAGQNLFLRAWGTAQHPVLADAWAAGAIEARKIDIILE